MAALLTRNCGRLVCILLLSSGSATFGEAYKLHQERVDSQMEGRPTTGDAVVSPTQVILWDNPNGGSFQLMSNWDPVVVPGPGDDAVFDLSGSGYSVSFSSDVTNNRAYVLNDIVTFELGAFTYEVTGAVEVGTLGSNGQLTVHGAGIEAEGTCIGCNNGTGLLRIENGSSYVAMATLEIGANGVGSNGTVIVTGIGSSFSKTECCDLAFGFGDGATGSLTIENGATATFATGNHFVGREGGEGFLTLQTGGQLLLTDSNFYVAGGAGGSGPVTLGHVSILSGADLDVVNGAGFIATGNSDASGEVTVSGGSTWTLGAFLNVGESGHGVVTIESGAIVSSASSTMGVNASAIGEATVSGAGSTWTNPGHLTIGFEGNATLSLENGAVVDMLGPGFGELRVGELAGSTGILSIDGSSSLLRVNDSTYIGRAGHGELLITNRGALETTCAHLGIDSGSVGNAVIDGALSAWNTECGIFLGFFGGMGSLTVSNGGHVAANGLRIGDVGGGLITISGPGSRITAPGPDPGVVFISAAAPNTATLTIEVGATLDSGRAEVGHFIDSYGEVTLTGAGSDWTLNGPLAIGIIGRPSTAIVIVGAGTRLEATAIQIVDLGNHLLEGDGLVVAEVYNGGFVEPGLPIGLLTIDGPFFNQEVGVSRIELAGLTAGTEYDRLAVTGHADLRGTLDLRLVNSFFPTAGDSFDILTYASSSGRFDSVIGSSPGTGLRWALDYNPTALTLIACDPVANPSCDDCNLNGVLDGEDIANMTSSDGNMDGIPDECAKAIANGDWNQGGTWDLGGGLYPDNNTSAADITATVAGFAVDLNIPVVIDGLRMLSGGVITALLGGGAGDLTVLGAEGAQLSGDPNDAEFIVDNDPTITISGGDLTVNAGARYRAQGVATGGCGVLTTSGSTTAAALLIPKRVEMNACVAGVSTASHGGQIILTEDMEMQVQEDLVMNGALTGGAFREGAKAQLGGCFDPPPALMAFGSSTIDILGDLIIHGDVCLYVEGGGASRKGPLNGAELRLHRDLRNYATSAAGIHLEDGRVVLTGGVTHNFEMGGAYFGASQTGFVDNFAIGELVVEAGANATLLDSLDNLATAGRDALYVHMLTLEAGSALTVDGGRLIYNQLNDMGGTITGINGGAASPLVDPPLPAFAPYDRRKNRYVSFVPNNAMGEVAFRVQKTTAPAGSCWVQTPVQTGANQYTALCDSTPVYRVWTEPVVHVGDCEVIPVADYLIHTNGPGEVENPSGLPVSTILLPSINSKLWGDTVGVNNGSEWTPPNQLTNVQDVLAILAFVSNAAVKPHFTVANLQAISSADSCLNAFVNTADVLISVRAIAGDAYGPPATGKVIDPAQCPACP